MFEKIDSQINKSNLNKKRIISNNLIQHIKGIKILLFYKHYEMSIQKKNNKINLLWCVKDRQN